jgi:hypothetical protein
LAHELGEVGAHCWLAAGEPNGVEAEPLDGESSEVLDLLVGEQLRAPHQGQTLGRHAVDAAQIATIGDRDP